MLLYCLQPSSYMNVILTETTSMWNSILPYLGAFIDSLYFLAREMAIWLLIGFLFAGVLHVFINKKLIAKFLGKNTFKSILYGSLLGIPLPLCSCGVIPTGIALYRNGASNSASVSFLISTPQTGIDSMLATYSLMGLPFAIIRPIVALVTGLGGGILTRFYGQSEAVTIEKMELSTEQEGDDSGSLSEKVLKALRYGFKDFFDDLAKWLFIGLLLAALMNVVIPDSFFTEQFSHPLAQMLVMLITAIPLYTCATGSIPIAGVLMMKGLSPGAALVFLMAGPATSLASIAVLGKALGRKNLISYLISIISGAVIFGLIIDYLLPAELFLNAMPHLQTGHVHESNFIPEVILEIGAGILGFLLIASFYRQKIKPMFLKDNAILPSRAKRVKIGGMNCQHCQANVENSLKTIVSIERFEVNLTTETAILYGDDIDLNAVKNAVEAIGYHYMGEV